MKSKWITSSAIGLFAGGILLLAVGTYTGNGGFQWAGGIMLVVAATLVLDRTGRRSGDP